MNHLPTDAAERNEYPLADGLFYYFPNALAKVAQLSKIANEQHNPGEPMHWARNKSTDHANKILRHQLDAGTMDSDNTLHSTKVAWRSLAQLEDELIAAGAKPGRNAHGAPAPKEHRRVAIPAELAACGVNALPSNLASAIMTKDSPLKHVELQAQDTTLKFPPYGPDNLPKKGHRVRVIRNEDGDTDVGQIGTVAQDNSRYPWIHFDERTRYKTAIKECAIPAYRADCLCFDQLERIG